MTSSHYWTAAEVCTLQAATTGLPQESAHYKLPLLACHPFALRTALALACCGRRRRFPCNKYRSAGSFVCFANCRKCAVVPPRPIYLEQC